MKTTKVIAFLILIIVCSASIASAQLQVTNVNRGVISRLYMGATGVIISSEYERSLELGEYSADVEMAAWNGLLTSAQNTLVTNEDYSLAYMSGHLEVSIVQSENYFPSGMDSAAQVEITYTSPFTCNYSLVGMVSGPGRVKLEIRDWDTWEIISTQSWTGAEFTTSGQLPAGTYSFHYDLLDYFYGDESASRFSECDFNFSMVPQVPVATEEISLGAVKALFR